MARKRGGRASINSSQNTADEAELLAFMAARLARYKVPRSVVFRAALPISAAGKILKRELRDEYIGLS